MIIEKTLNFATDFAISPIKGPQVKSAKCVIKQQAMRCQKEKEQHFRAYSPHGYIGKNGMFIIKNGNKHSV
ncbi:hypothetical protein [Photobacterium piscicola]|uniref:hypothetical protein n=1 Tax=Photobacterium piscicola TaxID=1378299 RepID=UPI00373515A2